MVYAVGSNPIPEMVVGSNPTLGIICARGETGKHRRLKQFECINWKLLCRRWLIRQKSYL